MAFGIINASSIVHKNRNQATLSGGKENARNKAPNVSPTHIHRGKGKDPGLKPTTGGAKNATQTHIVTQQRRIVDKLGKINEFRETTKKSCTETVIDDDTTKAEPSPKKRRISEDLRNESVEQQIKQHIEMEEKKTETLNSLTFAQLMEGITFPEEERELINELLIIIKEQKTNLSTLKSAIATLINASSSTEAIAIEDVYKTTNAKKYESPRRQKFANSTFNRYEVTSPGKSNHRFGEFLAQGGSHAVMDASLGTEKAIVRRPHSLKLLQKPHDISTIPHHLAQAYVTNRFGMEIYAKGEKPLLESNKSILELILEVERLQEMEFVHRDIKPANSRAFYIYNESTNGYDAEPLTLLIDHDSACKVGTPFHGGYTPDFVHPSIIKAQLLKDLSYSIDLSDQDNSFITQTTVAQYWHDTFSLATLILMERYKINLHDKLSDLSHRTGI